MTTIGLFHELQPLGGLQHFSRQTAAVLAAAAAEQDDECVFLTLRDPVGEHALVVEGREIRFRGYGGSKLRFALGALWAARHARLVYATHPYLGPLAVATRALRPTARVYVAILGIEVWEPMSFVRRLALRVATRIHSISRVSAERAAVAQRIPGRNFRVIGAGFTATTSAPREPEPVVLTVTRLDAGERYKGVDRVVSVLPRIASVVPDVRHVVVGEGSDRPRLEKLARTLEIDDRVQFTGRVSAEDLDRWYRRCALFALPSAGEGLGIVFLEAMARSAPVVAARSAGATEVVVDGVTGILVDSDDELADAIIELLTNADLQQRLGAAGRRRVHEEFSFERFEQRLRDELCAA